MKSIQIMGGKEVIISDEEAKKIMEVANTAKFISLSSGDFINMSSISCITNYKGLPYMTLRNMFNPVEVRVFKGTDNSLYYIDGNNKRVYLSDNDMEEVFYLNPEEVEKQLECRKEQKVLMLENKNKKNEEEIERVRIEEDNREKEAERWKSLSKEEQIKELTSKLEKTKIPFLRKLLEKRIMEIKKEIDLLEEKMCNN